jgi:PadR family transcriptional regulator PadR
VQAHDGARADWLAQARRGLLELAVLAFLDQQASYGYQLGLALASFGPALAASEGTLYPLLRRLLRDGLLQAAWRESADGPPRKYYSLTERGRALLRAQLAEWDQLTAALAHLRNRVAEHTEDEEVPDGSHRHIALPGRAAAPAGAPASD